MKQVPLLAEPAEHNEQPSVVSVVLDPETQEALVALMASALIAVVVAIEEGSDDDAG